MYLSSCNFSCNYSCICRSATAPAPLLNHSCTCPPAITPMYVLQLVLHLSSCNWSCAYPGASNMGDVLKPQENKSITVTMFRDPHKEEYDNKDWYFILEDVNPSGKRKPVAQVSKTPFSSTSVPTVAPALVSFPQGRMNMRDFCTTVPTQTQLTVKLRPLSKKVAPKLCQPSAGAGLMLAVGRRQFLVLFC